MIITHTLFHKISIKTLLFILLYFLRDIYIYIYIYIYREREREREGRRERGREREGGKSERERGRGKERVREKGGDRGRDSKNFKRKTILRNLMFS